MTTRNLNKTWRDVIWDQYRADLEAGVPFPIRYLIHAAQWRSDILITIPAKIEVDVLRRATLEFYRACHRTSPTWEGEHISVRARVQQPGVPGPAPRGDDTSPDTDEVVDGVVVSADVAEWASQHGCCRP